MWLSNSSISGWKTQRWKHPSGRLTFQQGQIPVSQTSKSLITWGKQGEISLMFQQVSQVSSFHQRQKDPAVQRRKKKKKTKNSHLAWTETTDIQQHQLSHLCHLDLTLTLKTLKSVVWAWCCILTNIALYLLKPSFFCQNLIHRFFRRFQKDLHEMKGPITSLLTASDQTGILNANSLPLQSTS